jgi:hypothetical protein
MSKSFISEFNLNNDLLVTINKGRESMYCDAKGNIFKVLKKFLQESLLPSTF